MGILIAGQEPAWHADGFSLEVVRSERNDLLGKLRVLLTNRTRRAVRIARPDARVSLYLACVAPETRFKVGAMENWPMQRWKFESLGPRETCSADLPDSFFSDRLPDGIYWLEILYSDDYANATARLQGWRERGGVERTIVSNRFKILLEKGVLTVLRDSYSSPADYSSIMKKTP